MHKNTMCALIGLAGAVKNNGKAEQTDALARRALLSPDAEDLTDRLHAEKHRVSPGCAACAHPCGNTADYPAEDIAQWPDGQRQLKEQLLRELRRIASAGEAGDALPELAWKAICYLGYDMKNEAYQALLEGMKKC